MDKRKTLKRLAQLGTNKRRRISADSLVNEEILGNTRTRLLMVEAVMPGIDLVEWATANRDRIEERLLMYGGILFRRFDMVTADALDSFVRALSGEALDYRERSSPRIQVAGRVYTSTEHPADRRIFLHNEQSYNVTFPRKILFQCVVPAAVDGATPVADVRAVADLMDPGVRRTFEERGYTYVRNYGSGLGLSWQEVFQTTDTDEMLQYCARNAIEVEWLGSDRLRTRQYRPVLAWHPGIRAAVWFNHLTFFHWTTLESEARDTLQAALSEDEFPHNTYYGDGKRIETAVMDGLRQAYEQAAISFRWRRGDLMLLDNMLLAHGREAFVGQRRVLTAMAEPYRRSDMGTVVIP